MKKGLIIMFVLLFVISFALANQNPNSINSKDETICCKIYGFGAYMEEVNVEYELMKKSECAVSEEFVGGGREVVENKFCKKVLTQEQVQNITRARNRLKNYYANQSECPTNCTCSGSTTKCQLQNGTREMTITAGNSGNTIVQVKNTNMSTNVTLYKSDDGKVYGIFKDNETHEVILPDEVRERIRNKTRARLQNETMNLTEDGEYQIQAKKQARLFWMFRVKENVGFNVDAETGEITKTKNSLWGFLAKDVKEEVESSE